jgi:hypothetical protein
MDLGVHLPLMRFGVDVLSFRRLRETVDAAKDCGFAAMAANDHLVFQTPWLDGPTALASVIERSGELTLATRFSTARGALADALDAHGRTATSLPNALATMWTWVSEDRVEGDRVVAERLAPVLGRDPDERRGRLCVGPAEHCAELLTRYAEASCDRVYLWPLGDEPRQLEFVASTVAPQLTGD